MNRLRSRRAAVAIAALLLLPLALFGCGGMGSGMDFQNPQMSSGDSITRINDGTSNTKRSAEIDEADSAR
jgi:hypothetical protein